MAGKPQLLLGALNRILPMVLLPPAVLGAVAMMAAFICCSELKFSCRMR